jgi:hypothetical protein
MREEWGKRGPKKYLRGTKVYLSISSAEQFPLSLELELPEHDSHR